MAKITTWQVWIIGVVLALIAGLIIYFMMWKPGFERKAAADTRYDTAHAVVIQEPQFKRELADAKKKVAEAKSKWGVYERRYMPRIDISDLITGMQQLWIEQIKVLGPKVEKFLRDDKTVRVVQAQVQLPPPPTDPNAVNQKVFEYNLGNVTVVGTFRNILNHVTRWNKFDRLVLADGLTLSGNSPNLSGTYNIRCFIMTQGTDNPGVAVPTAGGGAAGGFGGAGGPGAAGGFLGRPGGGPPTGFSGPGGGYPPPGVGSGAAGGGAGDYPGAVPPD